MNSNTPFSIPARAPSCLLRLALLRHGEPEEEIHGRCHGALDIGLSEKGRQQMRARVEIVRSLMPASLHSSTSRRAIESAAEIQKGLGLETDPHVELCEINFGIFEGLTYQEIEIRYPQEFKQWMEDPTGIKFPGGESFTEMKDRVLGFLDSLLQSHRDQTALVIAHAGVNRIILAHALDLTMNNIFRIDQGYAGLSVIDYFPQGPVVRLVNG